MGRRNCVILHNDRDGGGLGAAAEGDGCCLCAKRMPHSVKCNTSDKQASTCAIRQFDDQSINLAWKFELCLRFMRVLGWGFRSSNICKSKRYLQNQRRVWVNIWAWDSPKFGVYSFNQYVWPLKIKWALVRKIRSCKRNVCKLVI